MIIESWTSIVLFALGCVILFGLIEWFGGSFPAPILQKLLFWTPIQIRIVASTDLDGKTTNYVFNRSYNEWRMNVGVGIYGGIKRVYGWYYIILSLQTVFNTTKRKHNENFASSMNLN